MNAEIKVREAVEALHRTEEQDGGRVMSGTGEWTKNPRRDEERRRIAARLLDQGVPAKAIAAQLGVGRAWVRADQKQRQAAIDPDTAA